ELWEHPRDPDPRVVFEHRVHRLLMAHFRNVVALTDAQRKKRLREGRSDIKPPAFRQQVGDLADGCRVPFDLLFNARVFDFYRHGVARGRDSLMSLADTAGGGGMKLKRLKPP